MTANVDSLSKLLLNVAKISATVGVGWTALQSSLYVVDGGERAVVFNRFTGVEESVKGEVRDGKGSRFLLVEFVSCAARMALGNTRELSCFGIGSEHGKRR